ncbi:MAG TPA: tetratricopeptide repeat protein [Cellvibrio sp.]|nr:tetratricopeptide repeat protein [Cellvibrio sp.]
MRFTAKYLPSLLAIVFMTGLLASCSSGPKATQGAPTASAKVEQLAEKDRAAYVAALADLEKGNTKEAAASLNKIAYANPGYPDAWVNLASASYKTKNIDAAKIAIEHAHKLQPQSADIDNVRGLIYVEEGRYKDAEQLYIAALNLDPKNAGIHYNLALLYDVYYQDLAKAITHYESYLSLSTQKDEETEAWRDELKQMLTRGSAQ